MISNSHPSARVGRAEISTADRNQKGRIKKRSAKTACQDSTIAISGEVFANFQSPVKASPSGECPEVLFFLPVASGTETYPSTERREIIPPQEKFLFPFKTIRETLSSHKRPS